MSTAGEIAFSHFRAVLDDPESSATEKMQAAQGLRQISIHDRKVNEGTLHRMTRSQITLEIERVKALIED